jgi:hypothetical protein
MGAFGNADPVDRVLTRLIGASGTSYHCATAEIVQRHLVANYQRVAACFATGHPAAAATARALLIDNDMLMDRLLWMITCGPDSPSGVEPKRNPR